MTAPRALVHVQANVVDENDVLAPQISRQDRVDLLIQRAVERVELGALKMRVEPVDDRAGDGVDHFLDLGFGRPIVERDQACLNLPCRNT